MSNCPDCVTCPSLKRNLVISTFDNLSWTTRKALRKLDPLTVVTCKVLPPQLENTNADPSTNLDICTTKVDLGWKKVGQNFDQWEKIPNVKKFYHTVSPKFTTFALGKDDFFGRHTCIDNLINRGMSSTFIFPMQDKDYISPSLEETEQIVKDLTLVEGEALPMSYNSDFDMLSDESFSRTFFYSIFAPLVAAQKPIDPSVRSDLGPFVVDLPLQGLKVREKYRPYGARIHFSEDQQVTAIFDYFLDKFFKPGDEGWNEAKLLAKVTAFTQITAREHLIWSHLILSNTITARSILDLNPSHPLRRLLTIFTYRSTEVNLSAFGQLVGESAILHRACALKYESLEAVFDSAYESCDVYKPFPNHRVAPEIEKLSEEGKFPYLSQGREYYHIVHKFVSEWISTAGEGVIDDQAMQFYNGVKASTEGQAYELPEYSSINDMIDLISQSIFTVTAYHELVGGVIDFVKLPSRAGFRLLADHSGTNIDLQSFLLGMIIGASTAIRMPFLMRPFENYFGSGGAPSWETEVWGKFIQDLQEQSKKVQEEDTKRDVEFKYFDPANFECSISV
eukprot:CAMPEP_0203670752 /NCGR_PEP_ID=MMETSP0090-20130426/6741_1 /ASSEMBLY_ACC=CAM_ASM_001088 /TAXON_ID=426623 /ORGANISM="Chaetoceros affinis, Strain CCMP159" /LENGTH=563 /DNA_ID=CAMNT_0050535681 /DNA_START=93 /DNA_END=1784 /DNA_ORIENTATION=-